VGSAFGDAKVNIADMAITRQIEADGSAVALMLIKTDSEPPKQLLDRLRERHSITRVKHVTLPGRKILQSTR
jgi:hypothetical protein